MEELAPEQIQQLGTVFAIFIIIFLLFLFSLTNKILNHIILKIKVAKIKKLAKKTNLDGYVLKTNQKGIPVLLVSKNNPEDIFLI